MALVPTGLGDLVASEGDVPPEAFLLGDATPAFLTRDRKQALIASAEAACAGAVSLFDYDEKAVIKFYRDDSGRLRPVFVDPRDHSRVVTSRFGAKTNTLADGAARFCCPGVLHHGAVGITPYGNHVRGDAVVDKHTITEPLIRPTGDWLMEDTHERFMFGTKDIPYWRASDPACAFSPEKKIQHAVSVRIGVDFVTGAPVAAEQSPLDRKWKNLETDTYDELVRACTDNRDLAKRHGIKMFMPSDVRESSAEIRARLRGDETRILTDPVDAKRREVVRAALTSIKGKPYTAETRGASEDCMATVDATRQAFRPVSTAYRESALGRGTWAASREHCIAKLRNVTVPGTDQNVLRYCGLLDADDNVPENVEIEALRTLLANAEWIEKGTTFLPENSDKAAVTEPLGRIIARRAMHSLTEERYDDVPRGAVFSWDFVRVPRYVNGNLQWVKAPAELVMRLLESGRRIVCVVEAELNAYTYEMGGASNTMLERQLRHLYLLYTLDAVGGSTQLAAPKPVFPNDPAECARMLENRYAPRPAHVPEDDDDDAADFAMAIDTMPATNKRPAQGDDADKENVPPAKRQKRSGAKQ